jgi:hypothetical protein
VMMNHWGGGITNCDDIDTFFSYVVTKRDHICPILQYKTGT